jgi:hypothetical protein
MLALARRDNWNTQFCSDPPPTSYSFPPLQPISIRVLYSQHPSKNMLPKTNYIMIGKTGLVYNRRHQLRRYTFPLVFRMHTKAFKMPCCAQSLFTQTRSIEIFLIWYPLVKNEERT